MYRMIVSFGMTGRLGYHRSMKSKLNQLLSDLHCQSLYSALLQTTYHFPSNKHIIRSERGDHQTILHKILKCFKRYYDTYDFQDFMKIFHKIPIKFHKRWTHRSFDTYDLLPSQNLFRSTKPSHQRCTAR